MRLGIFADIHGNLQAFEAVMLSLSMEKVDRLFCLGDIVGYGANPSECLNIIRKENIITVAGNHDWAAAGKFDITYFNPMAKEAIIWTTQKLNKEEKDFLANLPLIHKEDLFVLVHGSLEEPERFHYIMDKKRAISCFQQMQKALCFVGHSHVPGIFIRDGQKVIYSSDKEIGLQEKLEYIVNVGSVGQPRDGNPLACYCIWDTRKKTITRYRVEYEIEEAQKRIMVAGLPTALALRLFVGR